MAEQVENYISYEIDYKEVNVLIIYFVKMAFQMTAITTNRLLPWVSYLQTELLSDSITSVLT